MKSLQFESFSPFAASSVVYSGPFRIPSLIVLFVLAFCATAIANPDSWARQGWSTDFTKHSIDYSEILSGGPPKDGIPSIDNPAFLPVSEIENLDDLEPVIGLELGGEARAYPLQVLMWHEIVNDTVGGRPVTVTYCPLCNAALVFDRMIDGKPDTFGTTGKLRNSDLVMYDRRTESWWQQFTGEVLKLLGICRRCILRGDSSSTGFSL